MRPRRQLGFENLETRTLLSTASVTGNTLTYLAGSTELSNAVITQAGGTFMIHDPSATITAGAGATTVDAHDVSVPTSGITEVDVINTTAGLQVVPANVNATVKLTGAAPRAGSYALNRDNPVSFSGITSFAFSGQGTDVFVVTPYADNTPAGWGLDVRFNETKTTDNQLVYDAVNGVADDINLVPSGAPEAGQLIDNGVSTITFVGVRFVDVVGNDGTAGDTDHLTLNGTDQADRVQVNLAAQGTSDDPILQLQNAAGTALLTLRNEVNFDTLRLNTGDGADVINVKVGNRMARNLLVDGGTPSVGSGAPSGNVLNVIDATGGATIQNWQGPRRNTGLITVTYPNGSATRIDYQNIDTSTLEPDRRYILSLYQDLLQRIASNAELDAWARVLHSPGGTLTQVAAGIELSPEAREVVVRSWYATYLGRTPQGGEERGWVNLLLAGFSEEAVLAQVLASPEYLAHASFLVGTPDAGRNFVVALYKTVLQRTPADADAQYWQSLLTPFNRAAMAYMFLNSQEYRTHQIASYYGTLLRRTNPPFAGDVVAWLSTQWNLQLIRIGLESSVEFYLNG